MPASSAAPGGESLLDQTRHLPADGLLQLNDVYGLVDGPLVLDDVDVVIETMVANSGRFGDREFRVDLWPGAMTYLATHIVELRDRQAERLAGDLERLGHDPGVPVDDELVEELRLRDAKIAGRAQSVGQTVVEVVQNHAPRTKELAGQNGREFFVGLTENGVIIYAQEAYLRDLQRDGRIIEQHLVKNENNGGLWPDKHQFRSAEVANSRSIPASRELLYAYESEAALRAAIEGDRHDYEVPEQDLPIEIVWVDKFGNAILRLRDPEQYSGLLVPGNELSLVIEGNEAPVRVGENLDDAETGRATIFKNPRTVNPRHIDLVVKLDDCLRGREHALQYVRDIAGEPIELRDLRQVEIDLEA